MKLVTFLKDGQERAGAWVPGRGVLDLGEADRRPAGVEVLELVRRQDDLLPRVRDLLASPPERAFLGGDDQGRSLLRAPLPRPVAMRDGYAFRQHVATARRNRGLEMIPEYDQFPVTYFTNHLAVAGPGPLPVQPHHLARLDFELEVAVVTGRSLRNASLAEADAAIFGFMVMNDWSARALQMEEMKLSLGPCKGKDFATGLGPWLVTPDELDLEDTPWGRVLHARMTCEVNGRLLSDGNADTMDWTFAQILQRVSYGVEVHPGEVLGSGTVGTGCLLELNGSGITRDLWLGPGDRVEMEVEGLGRLVNEVVAVPGPEVGPALVDRGPRPRAPRPDGV